MCSLNSRAIIDSGKVELLGYRVELDSNNSISSSSREILELELTKHELEQSQVLVIIQVLFVLLYIFLNENWIIKNIKLQKKNIKSNEISSTHI